LFENQAWFSEAIAFWQQVLAAQEKTYGPEHPQVASSLTALGKLYLGPAQLHPMLAKLQRKGTERLSRRQVLALPLKVFRSKKAPKVSEAELPLLRALSIRLKSF